MINTLLSKTLTGLLGAVDKAHWMQINNNEIILTSLIFPGICLIGRNQELYLVSSIRSYKVFTIGHYKQKVDLDNYYNVLMYIKITLQTAYR